MAEVKNTFIQSKMNQDLDGRILPNGQYRFGNNISISRSDAADVGALENVLGTNFITSFDLDDCAFDIIGAFVDVDKDTIFVFITDYTDNSTTTLDNNISGMNAASGLSQQHNCYIGYYNAVNSTGGLLVGGDFLNFAKNYPITGINVVEDLLFWTDNRNQPRKINITTASQNPFVLGGSPGYYTTEDHISVAKYYPFETISLLKNKGFLEGYWNSTMSNKSENLLPVYCIAEVNADATTSFTIELVGIYNNLEPGVIAHGVNIVGEPEITLVQPNVPVGMTTITLSVDQTVEETDLIHFSFRNPDYDGAWPGDKAFLSDKFVRFSYRYKFDDGEYSLMAPFTQAAFVPKQDGYFLNTDTPTSTPPVISDEIPVSWPKQEVSTTLLGDEGRAYDSTIVEFFENKIQDIQLQIPCAWIDNDRITYDTLGDSLKVVEIDIIYKDSDSNTAYILDTIEESEFGDITTDFYEYDYQSREPWKTLPERELLRVYDKVPLRALAQEVSGNRVIYGNYIDKHTSPDDLPYVCQIDDKPTIPFPSFATRDDYVRKEYQNHTVKQNRTYQVGIVLSDRYGRQSDVILSSIYSESLGGYGSTIYHPYRDPQNEIINNNPNADTWPGDMINIIWHDTIPKTINKEGYPGLYERNNGTLINVVGATTSGWSCLVPCAPGTICDYPDLTITGIYGATAQIQIQADGNTGELIWDTMVVLSSSNDWQENEPIANIVNTSFASPGCTFSGTVTSGFAKTLRNQNTLGWYSYKIVVKQTEQDYYNVFLPGILQGWPHNLLVDPSGNSNRALNNSGYYYPKGDENKTAFTVLIGDNINKVPRDMESPGPTQNLFGSDVKLFGRVENVKVNLSGSNWSSYNRQFDPGIIPDTVPVEGNLFELKLGLNTQVGAANYASKPFSYSNTASLTVPIHFYNGQTNPLVAKLSTRQKIGWPMYDSTFSDLGMVPYLAIYETAPVVSELDIYWETSSSGLISDLNYNIINVDNTIPVDITEPSIDIIESQGPNTDCSGTFSAVAADGTTLENPINQTTVSLAAVYTDLDPNTDVKQKFQFIQPGLNNEYQLKTAYDPDGYFLAWANNERRTFNFIFQVDRPAIGTQQALSFTVPRKAVIQNATPIQGTTYTYPAGPGMNTRDSFWNCSFPLANTFNPSDPFAGGIAYAPSVISWSSTTNIAEDCGCNGSGGWGTNGTGFPFYQPANEWLGNQSLCDIYDHSISDTNYLSQFTYTCLCGDTNCNGSNWGNIEIGPCCNRNYGTYTDPSNGLKSHNKPGAPGLTPEWDGTLKCSNGAFGSPGTIFPRNPDHGQEIVYSIARVYQVSAFFDAPVFDDENPVWITGDGSQGGGSSPCLENEHLLDLYRKNKGEIVFGPLAMTTRMAPKILNANDSGSYFPEYTFDGYLNPEPPTGPVYFDFEYSATGTTDPQSFNGPGQGEAIVGERYMTPTTGRLHYWQDLADAAAVHPTMRNIVLNSDFQSYPKWGFWYVSKVEVQSGGSATYKVEMKQATKDWAGWMPDPSLGLGGNAPFDNPGLSSPNFAAWTIPTPVPAYANQVGAVVAKELSTWPYPADQPVPPGRYVVTVRATDRSPITTPSPSSPFFQPPSGDGLYWEWDIPVVLPCPTVADNGTNVIIPSTPQGASNVPWD